MYCIDVQILSFSLCLFVSCYCFYYAMSPVNGEFLFFFLGIISLKSVIDPTWIIITICHFSSCTLLALASALSRDLKFHELLLTKIMFLAFVVYLPENHHFMLLPWSTLTTFSALIALCRTNYAVIWKKKKIESWFCFRKNDNSLLNQWIYFQFLAGNWGWARKYR